MILLAFLEARRDLRDVLMLDAHRHGMEVRGSPFGRNTPILPGDSTTASVGTTSTWSCFSTVNLAARVHAGLQPVTRIRNLDFHLRRARRRVEDRRDARDAAVELSPGKASTSISVAVPWRCAADPSRRR